MTRGMGCSHVYNIAAPMTAAVDEAFRRTILNYEYHCVIAAKSAKISTPLFAAADIGITPGDVVQPSYNRQHYAAERDKCRGMASDVAILCRAAATCAYGYRPPEHFNGIITGDAHLYWTMPAGALINQPSSSQFASHIKSSVVYQHWRRHDNKCGEVQ